MKYGNTEEDISDRKKVGRMKSVWIWIAIALISVALVAVVMVGGCIEERRQDSFYYGTLANLTIDKAPALNQTAELTLTISAVRNLSNISAKIILPEGLEFLSGDLYWHGQLLNNQSQILKVKVRAVKIGDWMIDGAVTGSSDQIYLAIRENEGSISEKPFKDFTRGKKYAEAK